MCKLVKCLSWVETQFNYQMCWPLKEQGRCQHTLTIHHKCARQSKVKTLVTVTDPKARKPQTRSQEIFGDKCLALCPVNSVLLAPKGPKLKLKHSSTHVRTLGSGYIYNCFNLHEFNKCKLFVTIRVMWYSWFLLPHVLHILQHGFNKVWWNWSVRK